MPRKRSVIFTLRHNGMPRAIRKKSIVVTDREERRLHGGDLDPFGRAQVIRPEDYFGISSEEEDDVPTILADGDVPLPLTEIYPD